MTNPLNAYGVTAYAWFNALGTRTYRAGKAPVWELEGSGLQPARTLPWSTYWGPSADPLPAMPDRIARHKSRCSQLLWASLRTLEADILAALHRWGPRRVGLVVGSSTGGIDVTEQVIFLEHRGDLLPWDYDFDAVHPFSALVHMARSALGFEGPGYVVSTACSSSAKALAAAQRLLEAGTCDAVITGGADALCQMTLRGFSSLGILSSLPCRPFDVARDGISIGEGSSVLLLEREARPACSLLAAGESNDAYHGTAPHPEGLGARLALQRALQLSALDPSQVDYVNAHGTGTRQNDAAEALALAAVLGPKVAYSSTKDRVGHQLGAAGATEAAFCLDALLARKMPGNRAGTIADPELAVAPLPESRPGLIRQALSSSFAFGGSNAVIVVGGKPPPRTDRKLEGQVWIESIAFWAPGYPTLSTVLFSDRSTEGERPAAALLPARPRGRASMLTRLFAELLEQLTTHVEEPADSKNLPLVFGSALGEMSTTLNLLDQMGRAEAPSPAAFQSSVHNTAAGIISIALENRAFSTALAAGSETLAMSLLEANAWLSVHGGRIAVLVGDEDAPRRLTRKGVYPAAGIGFLLRLSQAAPPGALGSLTEFERRPHAGTCDVAYAGDMREHLAQRIPGLDKAPASHGLALASALLARREGRYPIGDEWTVRVEPVNYSSGSESRSLRRGA